MKYKDVARVYNNLEFYLAFHEQNSFITDYFKDIENPSDFESYQKQVLEAEKEYRHKLNDIHDKLLNECIEDWKFDETKDLKVTEYASMIRKIKGVESRNDCLDVIFLENCVEESAFYISPQEYKDRLPQEFKDMYKELKTTYLENLKNLREAITSYYSKP